MPAVIGVGADRRLRVHALRTKITPLIEVVLFRNRQFAAAAATTFCFGAALFGGMFLLPLYYQVVRGQSRTHRRTAHGTPGHRGGDGHAARRQAHRPLRRRADRAGGTGAGRSSATVAYTQLGAHTSFALLAVSLFVRGIGFGFVMMPAISAAYQTLAAAAGAPGLDGHQHRPAGRWLHRHRTGGGGPRAPDQRAGPRAVRRALTARRRPRRSVVAKVAQPLASAFGHTFWWVLGMTVVALVPALLLVRGPATRRRRTPPPSID